MNRIELYGQVGEFIQFDEHKSMLEFSMFTYDGKQAEGHSVRWGNFKAGALADSLSPGDRVMVIGSVRTIMGQTSIVAKSVFKTAALDLEAS